MDWLDRWRARAGAGAEPDPVPPVLRGLEEQLATVVRELDGDRQRLLLERMRVLQRRQVPLRTLRPAPVVGTARLGFADGTVLLVRSTARADVLALGLFGRGSSVRVARCWWADDGPVAELAWPGRRLPMVVLGTDQPD